MTNPVLTSIQRKQAISDLTTLKIRLSSYSTCHPKKHGLTLIIALASPVPFLFMAGYAAMLHSLIAGSVLTLVLSGICYGVLGVKGFLKPSWKNDQISQSDLERFRDFSEFLKSLMTESMEGAGGKLTYTQLEEIAVKADYLLRKDEMRAMVAMQLQPNREPRDFSR